MTKTLRSVLAGAIALLIVPATLASPSSVAFATEEVLPHSSLETSFFSIRIESAVFNHDDSSLYFAENGASGVRQILSTTLKNSGLPIAASQDGMDSFRSEVAVWQNRYLFSASAPSKDGHYWIYSAAGNCSVLGGVCQSAPSVGGLWAIDTTDNNRVSRIPLYRANGEGQEGQLKYVTGTPNGKYVYAVALRGGRNTGPDEFQLFKIDAMTNTQIGLGVPVGFGLSIHADNNYVYGLRNSGGYGKIRIDGDQNSATKDSAVEPITTSGAVLPDLANAASYKLQGGELISGSGDSGCQTGSGQIGLVNTTTNIARVVTLAAGVFPINPLFGGDGNIYAFDLCSSRVIKVDPATGAILAQTAALTAIGGISTTRPFGVMSNNGKSYVVGGRPTGGLAIIDIYPVFKPTLETNVSVSGTGLQGTYLNAGLGTWEANPVASKAQQWYRCDKSVAAGLTAVTTAMKCSKISGATTTRYKVALVDANKYLTGLVKATNSVGRT
jgi:hypothetical protein